MKRLNYANVMATLAMFLALGGTSIAAKHYLITNVNQISPQVLHAIEPHPERGKEGKTGPGGASNWFTDVGPTGAQGSRGVTGPAGIGALGAQGPIGPEGKQGERGERGFPGPDFGAVRKLCEFGIHEIVRDLPRLEVGTTKHALNSETREALEVVFARLDYACALAAES